MPAPAIARLRPRVSGESSPELALSFVETSYLVTGSTVAQWLESMALLGPLRGGERRAAHTDWRLTWSYVPARVAAGHAVGAVRVRLAVETILPAWIPPPRAEPELLAAWETLSRRIERHERGHREVGIAGARSLVAALRALPPEGDLARLHETATAAAAAVLEAAHAQDADWDRAESREWER